MNDEINQLFEKRLAPKESIFDIALQKEGITGQLADIARSIYAQESSSGKNTKTSNANAIGGMQIIPKTFNSVADKNWNIYDPEHNARAGIRYLKQLHDVAGGDPELTAVGYYGGEGAINKAKQGIAVSDPRNPNAPNTLQYAQQVVNRIPESVDPINELFNKKLKSVEPTNEQSPESNVFTETHKNLTVSYPEQEKKSNIQGMSDTELALAGAKKSLIDLGQGTKQLLDIPAQFLEKKFADSAVGRFGAQMGMPTAVASAAQTEKDIAAEREASKELMETGAGMAGYIGGNIATTLAGGALLKGAGLLTAGEALLNPQSYKAAATAGAALGALNPTIEGESKLMNTAAGAILGVAGKGVVDAMGRIAQPVKTKLDEMSKTAVDVLKKAGVPLDAAQATGSTFLARVKAGLTDNPITAGKQAEISAKQQAAYTRAVSKTMGEDADRITPEVIAQAQNRIGKAYDDVAAKVNISVDGKFQKSLSDLAQEAQNVLKPDQFAIIERNIGDIYEKATMGGGRISGDQYQVLKRGLDRLSKSADTDVATYAREMRDVINEGLYDSAVASGNTHLVDVLKKANKQWGNMRKIEDIALKDTSGFVSPSSLYNSLTSKSKRNAFYAEDTTLPDLARAGKMILPEKLPNSGTAARLMNLAAPGIVGGIGYGLYTGDVGEAAKATGLGIVTPKLAQMLINNPTAMKYLQEGIGPGVVSTPLRKMLELPQQIGAQKLPGAAFNAFTQTQQQKR